MPDDYIEVFVTFFKEFGWKIDDCLNLSLSQIRFITETYIEINTNHKKSRIKTKDGNIKIIDTPNKKPPKTLNQLVKEKEKLLGRSLTVNEMNELIN